MAETNLSVEEQIRTAISQYDEQAKSRAEELQAAISRCEKLEAIFAQKEAEQAKNVRESLEGNTISKPRNLVVCIDGTSYELRTQGVCPAPYMDVSTLKDYLTRYHYSSQMSCSCIICSSRTIDSSHFTALASVPMPNRCPGEILDK